MLPNSFPTVAWLGCFRLTCPDLATNCRPDSNTYKSHRYTSQLKQYRYSNGYTHSQLSYVLCLHKHNWYTWSHIFKYYTGELKGPAGPTFFCWAHLCSWILLEHPIMPDVIISCLHDNCNVHTYVHAWNTFKTFNQSCLNYILFLHAFL